jgi:hypothetical protein
MQQYQSSLLETLLAGDFFESIGMVAISDEDKAEILGTMTETVSARVFSEIIQSLSDEDRKLFKELDADTLVAFLSERGIDLINLLVEAALQHRMEVVMVYKSTFSPEELTLQPA